MEKMKIRKTIDAIRATCILVCFVFVTTMCSVPDKGIQSAQDSVHVTITTSNKSLLFSHASSLAFDDSQTVINPVIEVDTSQRFQEIDGFGYTLTGGSAFLLKQKLSDEKRAALLRELFSKDGNNIGISYLRISVGASDLDDEVFSYDDMAKDKTDPTLANFSLAPDEQNLIPVLKEILAIAPDVKIMGSPWSAPAWMKSNNSTKGGSLRVEYYDFYSRYLVKYVQEMAKHGIPIDAITLQNEPENPNNNPSMVMTAQEQTNFVKSFLGPAFTAFGINTKIIVFDHNCDHPDYPISILNDTRAKRYVNGTAFHMYLGDIEALSKVHDAHPDRNIYFTEQWTSGRGDFGGDLRWHVKNLIVGASRNWAKTVLEWNLAADPQFNPHTDDGGCTECLGAITVGDSISRNVSYYIIAHASKYVRPGSIRVDSNNIADLPNVAFQNPSGKMVLIVLNDANEPRKFGIRSNGKIAVAELPGGAVGTFVWE
jgi:glucosylceramidase